MNKITVRTRVLLVGAAWSLITLVCGGVVYVKLQQQLEIQGELEKSKDYTARFQDLLTIMVDMETGIRGYLLSGEDAYLEPFNAAEGKFDKAARELGEKITPGSEQQDRLKGVVEAKKGWIEGPAVEEMMARRKLSRGMIDNQAFTAIFKTSKGKELSDKVRTLVGEAIESEKKRSQVLLDAQKSSAFAARVSVSVGIALAIALGMSLLTFTINRLNTRIRSLVTALTQMAESFRDASRGIRGSSDSLLAANESTASALQSTSSAVTQISSMTDSNAVVAREAQKVAAECSGSAERVTKTVGRVITSIGEIDTCSKDLAAQIAQSNEKMASIFGLIQQICSKTQVINDIVFQTRLLSFNASVEAARAGEHGKGFSVVAEEVGNLAQMSGRAAKEISDLATSNQDEIRTTIDDCRSSLERIMKEICAKIEDGAARSRECESVLQQIQTNVATINQMIGQISQASTEQARGVKDISESIAKIDRNMGQNTTMAKSSASVACDLQTSCDSLRDQVQSLRSIFERANDPEVARPAATPDSPEARAA